jgi:hypothetical protein
MNPGMRARINDAHTSLVHGSAPRLVADTTEQKQVIKMSSIDIEREVIARERMKMLRRMAV